MEPTEEAVASFINFTSTTRDQAIAFLKVDPLLLPQATVLNNRLIPLKANNLDSQKAINAYFEDPTGPQPKVNLATRNTGYVLT